jgi:hypothetical protein
MERGHGALRRYDTGAGDTDAMESSTLLADGLKRATRATDWSTGSLPQQDFCTSAVVLDTDTDEGTSHKAHYCVQELDLRWSRAGTVQVCFLSFGET